MAGRIDAERIRTDRELDKYISRQRMIDNSIYDMFDMFYQDTGEMPTTAKLQKYRDKLSFESDRKIVTKGLLYLVIVGLGLSLMEWKISRGMEE